MTPALVAILVVFGGIAGLIGWRRASALINRQPLYWVDLPDLVTHREHDRQRRRRKRQLLLITLFYALTGAVGGLVFLLVISRH